MVIINIGIRKGGLYAVAFDEVLPGQDDNTILIYRDTLDLKGYKVGSRLSCEQLNELKVDSLCDRAYSKGLWLLNYKDYTSGQMYDKLVGDFGQIASEWAVEKLNRLHIIDDERFAVRYAEILIKNKNTPKKQAVYKLVQKGVDKHLAQNVCDDIEIDEDAQLKALVEKRYAHRLIDEQSVKKATASLMRKGFSFYNVKSVLKQYTDFCLDEGED